MFEFKDDKLGKVKVINVTEARGSIASIMGDKDSNYVITKNNRPVRVVVDYDFFRQVNASSRSQRLADAKGQSPKDPVKGLLQSKTEELQKQMAAAQQRRPDLFPPASYFQLPELAEDPPIEGPITTPVPTNEGQWAKQETPAEPVEPVQPENCAEIPEPPSEETVPPPEDTIEEIAKALRTPPPRGDYFDSYRKLYETPRYEPLFQASHTLVSPTTGGVRNNAPRATFPKAPSNNPTETMRQSQSAEAVECKTRFGQPDSGKPAQPVRQTGPAQLAGNLPSIQDLLSELGKISLSDEEEQKAS